MNQTEMTMGRRIAARRKELKMTQDALAQELGVSAQAVSKWENDLSCPDISILPNLARILGLTTDQLLGAQPETAVQGELIPAEELEDDDRPGIHIEGDSGQKFDIRFESPRRVSFSTALWLICTAALMLAGPVLKNSGASSIGFWSAVWISALIVWGVEGMFKRLRFSNVVAALGGVYFALEGLGIIDLDLGWEIVFPVLILLLGISLLIDAFRKKRGSGIHFTVPKNGASADIRVENGYLFYSDSFGENHYRVDTPVLEGGKINVSFGEHKLDLSGVESVAEGCTVELNSSFGETLILVPSRYRVNFVASKSFADASVVGHPDITPEGTIHLAANLSFGELTVKYI